MTKVKEWTIFSSKIKQFSFEKILYKILPKRILLAKIYWQKTKKKSYFHVKAKKISFWRVPLQNLAQKRTLVLKIYWQKSKKKLYFHVEAKNFFESFIVNLAKKNIGIDKSQKWNDILSCKNKPSFLLKSCIVKSCQKEHWYQK